MNTSRRQFLQTCSAIGAGFLLPGFSQASLLEKEPLCKISLAQWSLHKALFDGKLDHLDFAKTTKQEFGITGVEYVNQFFKDKAIDQSYLKEMKTRAEGEGVESLLIMIDREGNLGDADEAKRTQAVENHYKWVEAAKFLGCHSIRVNAASSGTYEEQVERAADGLRRLSEFGDQHDINVIVENHGGLSSSGAWLSTVMKKVDHPRCGTLPDFGNFAIDRNQDIWYDRYQGVAELMPYAKAVSVKTHEFDKDNPHITYDRRFNKETDLVKMLAIVMASGYKGYYGIEYEGSELDEYAGIRKSKEALMSSFYKVFFGC
ncbi:sugar phosphate isomerase/epimerase family protein [uncultured Rubinisphaera sp.]|uniref:sugar phosphate isomerase/epimerase family protein n=1 Tax=uncultured Rubinisphaera sp. TaxID=1678686 RepID=UPI0030DC5334